MHGQLHLADSYLREYVSLLKIVKMQDVKYDLKIQAYHFLQSHVLWCLCSVCQSIRHNSFYNLCLTVELNRVVVLAIHFKLYQILSIAERLDQI